MLRKGVIKRAIEQGYAKGVSLEVIQRFLRAKYRIKISEIALNDRFYSLLLKGDLHKFKTRESYKTFKW